VNDNFFDIGGHSLLMVQVHERLQCLLQREFPLITLLERPTIHSIAEFLQASNQANPGLAFERAGQQRTAIHFQRDREMAVRG
jgi:hypothetical protein